MRVIDRRTVESSDSFACFGSTCSVFVTGGGDCGSAAQAVAAARRDLLAWHDQFTRFDDDSELSRLNADPASRVPASPLMRRFARAVSAAARESGGLVDATLVREIRGAGYDTTLGTPVDLDLALRLAPERKPVSPALGTPAIAVDDVGGVIERPLGLMLDSGGLAKGLFADVLAERLASHASFAVDCGGDLRVGGVAAIRREVRVTSPFGDAQLLHRFESAAAGVATSGIGKRSWLDHRGRPAHHLLDPSTGRPAFTGVVQATAIAPTALQAEIRAKAAVLSGPAGAREWLVDGGVVVYDDGTHDVV